MTLDPIIHELLRFGFAVDAGIEDDPIETIVAAFDRCLAHEPPAKIAEMNTAPLAVAIASRIRTAIATEERAKCATFLTSLINDCELDAASGDHPGIADDLRIQADLLRGVIEKIGALP